MFSYLHFLPSSFFSYSPTFIFFLLPSFLIYYKREYYTLYLLSWEYYCVIQFLLSNSPCFPPTLSPPIPRALLRSKVQQSAEVFDKFAPYTYSSSASCTIHESWLTRLSVVIVILYFATLDVRLFVSNKRQNGRTDQAYFFVGPLITPGKMYGRSNFQKFSYDKIRFLKI